MAAAQRGAMPQQQQRPRQHARRPSASELAPLSTTRLGRRRGPERNIPEDIDEEGPWDGRRPGPPRWQVQTQDGRIFPIQRDRAREFGEFHDPHALPASHMPAIGMLSASHVLFMRGFSAALDCMHCIAGKIALAG